jgi:hypothetical protein
MGPTDDDSAVQQSAGEVVNDTSQAPAPDIVAKVPKPVGIDKSGFFDPTARRPPVRIVLERLVENDRETFELTHTIGYWDEQVGGMIVPADLAGFRTDLTSVPRFFTWLIPTTGTHLPAALIHDGLVHDPSGPPSYIADRVIDRVTADRIFRSGMRDLGTSSLRRWLVWTAVATATMTVGPFRRTWPAWVAIVTMVGAVVLGGTLATIDLFDCRAPLPWMADRPAWLEVIYGAIVAVVAPLVLSVIWRRRWAAGVIAGTALALLLHVTVAIVIVYGVFSSIDSLIDRKLRRALLWGGLALGLSTVIIAIGVWAC